LVNDSFKITTVQYFNEVEDKVIIRCAEYVPQFEKGYVCDMVLKFQLVNEKGIKTDLPYYSHSNDLVLVHIRKRVGVGEIPEFEYVFYKS